MIKIDDMHRTKFTFKILNDNYLKFRYFINIKIKLYFNIFIDFL
jgi:hypothetical protein